MKVKVNKICVAFYLVVAIFSFQVSANEAVVTYVKGKVEYKVGDKWLPVEVGQKLSEKTIVSTGFQSHSRIQYKGTVMALGPLTRVTLEKLAESDTKEVVNVYLNTGAVRSKVTHPQNKRVSQSIRNPVTVCSVRGTEYISFAGGRLICFEGAVATYPVSVISEDVFTEMDVNDSEDEEFAGREEKGAEIGACSSVSVVPADEPDAAAGEQACGAGAFVSGVSLYFPAFHGAPFSGKRGPCAGHQPDPFVPYFFPAAENQLPPVYQHPAY